MEFEDLSEKVQFEARRVAVAFGVKEQSTEFNPPASQDFEGQLGDGLVIWSIDIDDEVPDDEVPDDEILTYVMVTNADGLCEIRFDGGSDVFLFDDPAIGERMTRGLYCLGCEDDEALRDFPLTAHEKLELRLSMPREFWPRKWLDEEG